MEDRGCMGFGFIYVALCWAATVSVCSSWYTLYPLKRLMASETIQDVTSPNYPDFYPVSTAFQCVITTSSSDDVVWLQVKDVELKKFADYVDIYDGGEDMSGGLLARIWYFSTNGTVVVSTKNQMYIKFHAGRSDTVRTGRGFWLVYTSVQRNSGSTTTTTVRNRPEYQCSDTIKTVYTEPAKMEYIVSSHYPVMYPGNTVCRWRVMAPMGRRLRVILVDIDLQSPGMACTDSVTLYDQDSLVLGEFCATSDNGKYFNSTGQHLTVEFVSDGRSGGRGFVLVFEELSSALPITTTTLAPVPTTREDPSIAIIVGIAVGAVGITLGVVVATCVGVSYVWKRSRSHRLPPLDNQHGVHSTQPLVEPSAPPLPPGSDSPVFTSLPPDETTVTVTSSSADAFPSAGSPCRVPSRADTESCSGERPGDSAPPPAYGDLNFLEQGVATSLGPPPPIAPPPSEAAPPAYSTVSGHPNTFV